MKVSQIIGFNEYIGRMESSIDSQFYLDGCHQYMEKGWNKHKWDYMLHEYLKARWWIFTRQN